MHGNTEGVSIPPGEYIGQSHIISLDLENMYSSPGAAYTRFTGLSTMGSGDCLRFSWQNVNARNDASRPSRCFITLHHDTVIELRQEGALCLD